MVFSFVVLALWLRLLRFYVVSRDIGPKVRSAPTLNKYYPWSKSGLSFLAKMDDPLDPLLALFCLRPVPFNLTLFSTSSSLQLLMLRRMMRDVITFVFLVGVFVLSKCAITVRTSRLSQKHLASCMIVLRLTMSHL